MVGPWFCKKCTFQHKAPAVRCVMCGELRVTKEEMRGFVQGQPVGVGHVNVERNASKQVGGGGGGGSNDTNGIINSSIGRHVEIIAIADSPIPMQKQTLNPSNAQQLPRNTVPARLPPSNSNVSFSKPTGSNTGLKKTSTSTRIQTKISNPYNKKIQKDVPVQTTKENQAPSACTLDRSHGLPQVRSQGQGKNTVGSLTPGEQRNVHPQTNIPPRSHPKKTTGHQQQKTFVRNPYNKRPTQPQNKNLGDPNVASYPIPSNSSRTRPGSSSTVTSSSSNTTRVSSSHTFRPVSSNTTKVISTIQRNDSSSGTFPHLNSLQKNRLGATNSSTSTTNNVSARQIIHTTARTHTPFTIASQGQTSQPILDYQPGPVPLAADDSHKTWTYPLSDKYGEREYQVAIARSAIHQNTLVSLPTGLGKTLIAAVVMYNFYRWFPTGKVVFLAPTRPLVTQQIEACYNIMGIPETDTAEMSGKTNSSDRGNLWETRRVFFCTPQTFQKDLESGSCSAKNIVCVVFDEAHKATGKYAYVNVINLIEENGARFRVLGLSATPGKNIATIRKVVEVLRISKIEVRFEDDEDVKQYVHSRKFEVIVVEPPSQVVTVTKMLDKLLNTHLHTLKIRGGLPNWVGINSTPTAYFVHKAMNDYIETSGYDLMQHFSVAQTLLRVRECLRDNGIGVARKKLSEFMSKHTTKGGFALKVIQSQEFIDVWMSVIDANSTGKSPSKNTSEDLKINNPKLDMLDKILREHFNRARACGESSRAIVFSQLRDSVEEIVNVLHGSRPLVKATKFVGQSSGNASKVEQDKAIETKTHHVRLGMKQKEQQRAIVEFREGVHNVLVCTSIGEEGLDIGQVDLIINFDCLSSPIRMIQRTGRTGRKRDGKVVCLVTKGEEEKKLDKSGSATKLLRRALKESSHFPLAKNIPLTPYYPRMEKKAMEINSSYHLSQIGGHNRIRKPKKTNKNWQHDSTWKLSVADNEDCNNLFGFPTFSEFSVKKSITSWQSRLIQSRNHKAQIPENCLGKGRSCSLLRRIEFLHCSENGNDLTTKLYHHLTPSLKDLEANDACSESCSKHEDNDAMNLDANDACSESSSKYEYNDAIIFESDCDESSIISNNIQPREEINYNTQENKIACQSSPTSRHDLNRIFGPNESWNFEQKESERKIQEIIFGNAEVLRPVTPPLENIRHEQLIESTQNEAEAKSCKSHFELPKENISQDEKWLAFDCVEDNRTVGSKKNTESSVLIFDEKKDTRKDKDETQNHIVPTYGDDEVRCEFVLPTQFDDSSSSSSEDKRENIKMNAPKDDADNEIQNSEVSKHGDEKVRCEIVLPSQFDDSSTSSEDEGGNANLQGPEKPKSSQNIDHSLETDGRLQLPGEKISTSYDNCSSNIKPQNTPRIFLSESVQNDTKTMKKDEEENVVVHQHLNDTTYSKDAIPIRNEINEKYTPEDSLKNINTKDIQQGDADKLKPIVQEEDEIISFCFDIPTQSSSSSSDGSSDKDSDSGRSALDRTDVRNSDACNILHAPESLRQSQREQVLGDDLTPIVHKRRKLSIHKKKSLKKIIFSQVMSTPHTSVGECDLTDTPQKSVGPSEILSQTGALVDTPLQSKRDRSTSERRVFQNKKKQAKIHENASTRRKYRQSQCNLLDIEANAASDDEATYSEDEECNFKNQSQDSFINDTSQLGYTQDALDLVENNVDSTQCGIKGQTLDDKAIHRVVDNKWNQTDMFSTPILRRRKCIKADGSTQISQLSMPSSDRGLGKMHFIRSVLEHHKAGGDDEEIEKEYHSILKDKVGLPTQTTNVLHGKESVGTVTNLSNVGNRQSSTLSEEQKLRIRENRRLALIRRAAHQKEKCKFSNDSF